ncbi:MAG TPA: family 20 glycosylhydrolase [Candidatus Dormibacteraeota bacterium]|jgi:hexosaminidase|nr:family 20 glycosylhydrolase [Candidatus Dormibacteraeota bacterium]
MQLRAIWRRVSMILMLSLLGGANAKTQSAPILNLMPWPANVQNGSGALKIDESFRVTFTGYTESRLDRAGQRFMERMHRQTGVLFAKKAGDAARATLVVHADKASKEIQELGEDESYTLEVTPQGAKLNAANPLGVLRGLQTFLQLVDVSPDGFAVPAVSIKDQPRFAWRGLMIDSSRHFTPLDVLKRNLDGMEAVKLNVFHWHISDNQGFRAESKKFPKLVGDGSEGMYYTQDEIRDVIAYARDRGMRVVPEFDMPGHSTSWLVGYPELASTPGPFSVEQKWGVMDPAMDPTNEKIYKFLDTFIGEMAKLFPDHYFHIGGDEVNGKAWDANPKIQEFKKGHNFTTNEELQAYFSGRVQKLVNKHGKATIGWDEIFVPGAPKDIVIHSWRGSKSLAAAAKQGYQGILSNGYYIDLMWSAARHYAVDPLSGDAGALSPEEQKRVLGGEATMWSEYVNWENIDSRIWPRTAAIAERYWSPQSVTDVNSMYARLEVVSEKLEWVGLTHKSYCRKMLQRIAGAATPEEFAALETLVDVLEPVKDYTREQTATYHASSATPLNRVVDAASPDSDVARHFDNAVTAFVNGSCKDTAGSIQLRMWLMKWQGNDAALQSLAHKSSFVNEVAANSQDLSAVAGIGLVALDAITKGTPLSDDAKAQATAKIADASKGKAQLLLIPAPTIQKLVDVASNGGACAAKN